MQTTLIQFLSTFKELSESQIQELAAVLKVATYKKNQPIVTVGQPCNVCYFVLKGCLRQYVEHDGIEKTIALYTENQAINYFTAPNEIKKSETFLPPLEDSILLVGNPETDQGLLAKFPILVDITRKMIEEDLRKAQYKLSKFIISSPEQRYLNLLEENPTLFQRVPQHFIASYLGMTPESLSRIRKRLSQKPTK